MWVEGQTDIAKLIVTFRNFSKAPTKKETVYMALSS
jgi:hypothetical protein